MCRTKFVLIFLYQKYEKGVFIVDFKTYKIGETYQNNKVVPSLRFNGKWLKELNFMIGEEVVVYQGKNMLLITKPNEREQQIIKDMKKQKELKQLKRKIKSP